MSAVATFLAIDFLVIALLTLYFLWKYTNWRLTSIYYLILIWIGWYLPFLVTILIPLDISSTFHRECAKETAESNCNEPWIVAPKETMVIIWNIVYWTTFVLCWTAFPFLQSWSTSGEFSKIDRFRAALKENLLLYTIGFVVLGILFIWIIAKTKPAIDQIPAIAIAAANAWGLFLLIILLGYGLVEIPRKLWRKANLPLTLRYHYYDTAAKREEYEKAKLEWETTLKLIRQYDTAISANHIFRPYVDIIISKCPLEYKDIITGEGAIDNSYDKLVSLHTRIKSVQHDLRRSRALYKLHVQKTINLEDISNSANSYPRRIDWTTDPSKPARKSNYLEWLWWNRIYSWFLRILCIILAGLSIVVIWSEIMFNFESIDLSIFALVLHSAKKSSVIVQWMIVFLSVSYIVFCAYWSLFQIRLFNYYRLVPHHETDANSALFTASYLCRLIAPIAYNFLLMIHSKETAFLEVMGPINLTPFLGKTYNAYFPIVLILFCTANLFNLYTKFVMACCIKRFHKFVFDESFGDVKIDQGKEIIQRERQLLQRGVDSTILPRRSNSVQPTQPDKPSPKTQESRFSTAIKGVFSKNGKSQSKQGLLENHQKYGSTEEEEEEDPFADYNNAT